MAFLDDLNPQQRRAVTAPEGPILVLAGPGSGKTRVLTSRVAYLVLDQDVPPWRVMAVTFTNKAAREMRERLEELLGPSRARTLTLGTFHATCARILRREAEPAGISRDYVIFDADDQVRLVKQAMADLNLDDKRYPPRSVLAAISQAKSELVPPEAYAPQSYYDEIVKRVYERYQALLTANRGLDFDDLLMVTAVMFRQRPEVLARYQEQYQHILVDEFQDTNQAQYSLLRHLTREHHNLFCVADEDQSIYRWRGADYRNIRRLRSDYPDLDTHMLERNYRSTQTILDAAQAVIRHNRDRVDKNLYTDRGQGPEIVVHEAYDQDDEAQFVVDTIAEFVAQEGRSAGDFAVMYRTNAQSRALEEAFVRAGLPYKLVGATRFYARREVKDLLAFLRLVHNPDDDVSMARVINVPARGIGTKTITALEDAAREQGISVYRVLQGIREPSSEGPDLWSRARTSCLAFLEMLEGWTAASRELRVAELVNRILEDTGYEDYIRHSNDGIRGREDNAQREQREERWGNVLELRNVATDYQHHSLAEFLTDVALVSEVDNLSADVDAPTLLTLHSAKGLEFPIVFITGLEEGLLPHSRSFDEPEEMAEERRLTYVGLTRAKDRLVLTYAFRRSRFGSSEAAVHSRFLDDIPDELTRGIWGEPQLSARERETTWESSLSARPPSDAEFSPQPRFLVGQRVLHEVFGEGMVFESRGLGDNEIVTVNFEELGLKRLMAGMSPMEVLEG
ncbi:MAG: UvrD-helicase domain-containing protein [Anaerolineae bacterium]|jgi:DNA helicase-2/ATP-dependent DNA helicase PcrA